MGRRTAVGSDHYIAFQVDDKIIDHDQRVGTVDVKFVNQNHEILQLVGGVGTIAQAARTCYQSNAKTEDADEKLVRTLIKNGHHAMLEFGWLMVRFVTDRATANELVRHRHLSFAQESTRYVGYDKKGFRFVLPEGIDHDLHEGMKNRCHQDARYYAAITKYGVKPEIARAILPTSTATTIVAAGNLREWRHVLSLRTAKDAHPQIRSLMTSLLHDLRELVPVIFDDIGGDYE